MPRKDFTVRTAEMDNEKKEEQGEREKTVKEQRKGA
jgi:hypothetical protein